MDKNENIANRDFKMKRLMLIVLALLVYIILAIRMDDIARWSIDKDLTELERMCVFLNSEEMQPVFEYVEENGILWNYPSDYKDEARRVVIDNCSQEDAQLYCNILFGGFSFRGYLENHTFDEFYEKITEMDILLPEYYDEELAAGQFSLSSNYGLMIPADYEEIILDEGEDSVYVYRKVTYWMCIYFTYNYKPYKL